MTAHRRNGRGFTFSEVLMSLLILSFVLAVAYQLFVTLYVGQMTSANEGRVSADSRQAISMMVDHMRNASSCDGSAGVAQSVLDSAGPTSFTYYSSTTCSKVTYARSGTNLTRQEDTNSPTTEAFNISSISFTYYKAATYNTAWSPTTDPQNPTAAELPYVCGVLVNVMSTSGNVSIKTSTIVRLRNAPRKSNVSGL